MTGNTLGMSQVDLPRHLAIIMDGNGRWATSRGKPRSFGHQAGFRTTRKVVELAKKSGIEALTLFAFSSENWQRPEQEVGLLMELFLRALRSEVKRLMSNNIQIRFIGDLDAFNARLRAEMEQATAMTAGNTGLVLTVAVSYGGHWDITNAAKQLVEKVLDGTHDVGDISPELFGQYISLADLPAPDLFIRTGGEKRISNYLLWQLAYTELFFTDTLWPDFDEEALASAFEFYKGRQRRFGKTGDQVESERA